MPRPASWFATALAIVLGAGCRDRPTQPRTIEGDYYAVQANDSMLPTSIYYYFGTPDRIRVLRGSLALRAPGTLVLVLQTAYVDPLGVEGTPPSDTIRARYVVNGSMLEFSPLDSSPPPLVSPPRSPQMARST